MNLVQQTGTTQRRLRQPSHPFLVSHLPYHIVPFLCAPVLAGETIERVLMQSRAVSDPIKNPLIGWWLEHYFFYVKLTDLYEREDIKAMVLNPAFDGSALTTAQGYTTAKRDTYYSGGTAMVDWVELCYRRVVDEYFRDEGESYTDHRFIDLASTGRTYSLAKIVNDLSAMQSVSLTDDETAQDVTLVNESGSGTLTASELDMQMRMWEMQRAYNITELTWEQWLQSHGMRAPDAEKLHRPELLRYLREWQYPTNTIDPTNGTPRSAVSWSIRNRLDQPRFCKEPGFLFGLTVARPKVYVRAQEGSFNNLLNDWRSWLPAMFQGDRSLSRKQVGTAVGPLQTVVSDSDGYVVDVADLFLYGEQFTNEDRTGTANNFMDNVAANLTDVLYPQSLADIDELFVTTGTHYVRQDGICSVDIRMNAHNPIIDYSPRGGPKSGE